MKLLLTSSGVTKRSIAEALSAMVGKLPSETKVGFIPTAANVEKGNKDWYINQFVNLWRFGYSWIDVVDPSAADVDWKTRFAEVDVLFVSGGNTFYLLDQMKNTGLAQWISENSDSKVYVGVSAGTIVAAPTIEVANIPPGDVNMSGLTDFTGLNWVNFEVEPHCDKERFAVVAEYAKQRNYPVYAIDDQTAIKVLDDSVEVVSEGIWEVYN